MEGKYSWLKRMLLGGCCAVAAALLVTLLVNFVLSSITWGGGAPDYSKIELTPDWCSAYFGSDAAALLVELLSVFALGAAVGLATLPFADQGKKLALLSLAHFLITGALAQAVGWAYQWLGYSPGDGPWIVLAIYVVIYALIWGGRWIFWYAELRKMRKALGLEGQHGKKEE